MQMKEINGEVRLSIKDFSTLFERVEKAEKAAEGVISTNREAIDMILEFLQFLGSKDYFKDIKSEFNASHDRLSLDRDPNTKRVILVLDGKKLQRKNS